MTLTEAARHAATLREDPSSAIAAALAGWRHPISREALILMDLFDLDVSIHTDPKKGKPKSHPGRPFEIESRDVKRFGDTGGRTREEIVALLNALGHKLS